MLLNWKHKITSFCCHQQQQDPYIANHFTLLMKERKKKTDLLWLAKRKEGQGRGYNETRSGQDGSTSFVLFYTTYGQRKNSTHTSIQALMLKNKGLEMVHRPSVATNHLWRWQFAVKNRVFEAAGFSGQRFFCFFLDNEMSMLLRKMRFRLQFEPILKRAFTKKRGESSCSQLLIPLKRRSQCVFSQWHVVQFSFAALQVILLQKQERQWLNQISHASPIIEWVTYCSKKRHCQTFFSISYEVLWAEAEVFISETQSQHESNSVWGCKRITFLDGS